MSAVVVCVCSVGFAQQDSTTTEDVNELKGAVESLQESTAEMRGILDVLRKIRFSGYLQTQYRATDVLNQSYPIGQFSGGTFPGNVKSQLQLRRGRFKVQYDGDQTNVVLQVDIGQSGVSVKDAYISLTDPWLKSVELQAGIFSQPFGYELAFSSGVRESPERSRVFQTLFPGDRDLGVKLAFAPQGEALRFLRADVGVFNGTGPTSPEFDNFKDIIARVAAQFPLEELAAEIDLGVSGYFGRVRNNSATLFSHGDLPSGMRGFVASVDTTNFGKGVTRRYYGVDLQAYYDMPLLGGSILRAEYITGSQPGTAATSVTPTTQPATSLYKRDFEGWYVMLVQNIGEKNQLLFKYDVFDPNTHVSAADFVTGNSLTPADLTYRTFGFGLVHHWDANVKFTVYYEIVKNETPNGVAIARTSPLFPYTVNARDNVLTCRIQFRY